MLIVKYKQHVESGLFKDIMLCTEPFHHCAPEAELIPRLLVVEHPYRDKQ